MKDGPNLSDCQERPSSTPEPFRYETKYLVLKFLGLSHNSSSYGSSGSGSSENINNDLSPTSSILVNYQSSRSVSRTSEESFSWKSGSHSSGASSRLNLSAGSANLKEFRSSSQPQSYTDRPELPRHVKKKSKSITLTPNSSFSSESSLNTSGQSGKELHVEEEVAPPSQQTHVVRKVVPKLQGRGEDFHLPSTPVTENEHLKLQGQVGGEADSFHVVKKVVPKPQSHGQAFRVPPRSGIPELDTPVVYQAQGGAFSRALPDGLFPDIPITQRDSSDTLEPNDEDLYLSDHEGRRSRQNVISSDSHDSVDTLLGEGDDMDCVDVFEPPPVRVIQKGGGWKFGDVVATAEGYEGNESEDDDTDGAVLGAMGGLGGRPPAFMGLLSDPGEPPDTIQDIRNFGMADRSINRGAGDRSGLNLEGLTQDAVDVGPCRFQRQRCYSLNTTVNYLQDDVTEALSELQDEIEEAQLGEQVPTDGIFSPGSPCSNVAHILGVIGDQVNQEYAHILEQASHRVLPRPTELVDYDDFRDTAEQIVDTTSQQFEPSVRHWYQAGLLLSFSKRVAIGMIQHGNRGLGRLAEYTTRAIEDTLANYIITGGGWNSVGELNLSSSPMSSTLSLSAHTPSPSTESNPFFPRKLAKKDSKSSNDSSREGNDGGTDEVDNPLSRSDTAIFRERPQSEPAKILEERARAEIAVNQDRPRSDPHLFKDKKKSQGCANGDGRGLLRHRRKWDAKDGENLAVGGQVDPDDNGEQSRMNQYLGYVHAGVNILAFSAGVACTLIKRQ